MACLPRFTQFSVLGYQMFPGNGTVPGISRSVQDGLTVVVGANGLGKTTLVLMLRTLCAGPSRLRNRSNLSFGTGKVETTAVASDLFSARVGDHALDATAELEMTVGNTAIAVRRSLKNLGLLSLKVDDEHREPTENNFQDEVCAAAGVAAYSDWIILNDYLMFVTEEAPTPFWDPNAQRQLLRVLTSTPIDSSHLSDIEEVHLTIDSDFRNARYQLSRHRTKLDKLAKKFSAASSLMEEVEHRTEERAALLERVELLSSELEPADTARAGRRQEVENAETQFQLAQDAFEAARLAAIVRAMPTDDDVEKYLRARLHIKAESCLLCGNAYAHDSSEDRDRCPVCGQTGNHLDGLEGSDLEKLEDRLDRAETALRGAVQSDAEQSSQYAEAVAERAVFTARRAQLAIEIDALNAKLPADAKSLVTGRTLLSDLEDGLEEMRIDFAGSRERLEAAYADYNATVVQQQSDIREVFDAVASEFLVEECSLVPHIVPIKIGQEGTALSVQSFDLDLGSATEVGQARRSSRDSVSESQRVYVDIAFRIALIRTCADLGVGTLVVDAPEGALDAVFSTNAARLLAQLVQPPTEASRVIVASNLVWGSLLPALASEASITTRHSERLIDLIELAAPTAAVRTRGADYRRVRDAAIAEASGLGA